MEASVAGQGDATQQGQQAQQGDGGGFDPAQFASTLESLQGSQEEMRQYLVSHLPQQQASEPEPEQEPEPELDLSFLDPAAPEFDPEQIADRLGGLIGQVADQRTQAAIAPMQEQMTEMRRSQEAERLAGEIPELGDPEVAQQTVQVARQIAEAYGQPALAQEPWFWRMTFMAARAAEAAQQEGDEAPSAAHLEGGGGAAPSGSEVDLGDQIIAPGGRKGRSALPFR